jgi:hypothetical protein
MGINGHAFIADSGGKALRNHEAILRPCSILAPRRYQLKGPTRSSYSSPGKNRKIIL